MADVTGYVVTLHVVDQTLAEINELNNHLTRGGFTLTLTDQAGKIHDPGTNSFSYLSPLNREEIEAMAAGLAQTATGKPVTATAVTFEQWLAQRS